MKAQWLLLTAVCALLAGSAFAQGKYTPKLTANVPFDFVMNDNTFPKGEYIVSECDDGRKLLVQNKTQPEYSAYVLNSELFLGHQRDNDGKMIFIQSNGQHLLHQIAFKGDNHINDIIHQGHDVIELVALR